MRYTFVKTDQHPIHVTEKTPEEATKFLKKILAKPIEASKYQIVATASDENKAPIIKTEDIPELVGQIIDIFEDFLDERGIVLQNPERDENEDLDPENSANIYGTDYGELQDAIEATLYNWNITETR